jgi:hypothetical protein
VTGGLRRLRADHGRALLLAAIFTLGPGPGPACSSGDAAPFVLDAATGDTGDNVNADADADVVPTGCVVTWLVPGTATSCRAGWRCDGGIVLTYACGEADGGARCFCIQGTTATLAPDQPAVCGQTEDVLRTEVPRVCQWTFLTPDDGGQP